MKISSVRNWWSGGSQGKGYRSRLSPHPVQKLASERFRLPQLLQYRSE